MGFQFSLIYDIVVGAILLGMLLSGMKRGFASAAVGLIALVAAFTCAMVFSAPISDAVYTSFVQPPLDEAVDSVADEALDSITLSQLSELDYSVITVGGIAAEELQPEYSSSSIRTYDLTDVDLSKTGITELDLTSFGFDDDSDYTALNGKTAEFAVTDIERYGLGRLIVAQVISVNVLDTAFIDMFTHFTDKVGEAIPVFFGDMSERIGNGDLGAIRTVVLVMMSTEATAKQAVIEGIIHPVYSLVAQTIIFCVIFLAVSIVLSLLAKVLQLVNKIPVLGGLNVLAGGIVGLVQGLLTVFVVCIVVRVITTVSDGSVMFFNNMAIEDSYVFKYFYNYDFLNFLN